MSHELDRRRRARLKFLLARGRASDRTVWNYAQVAYAAMSTCGDYFEKCDEMRGRSGIELAWRQHRARIQRQARRELPDYLFPIHHRRTGLAAKDL